MSGKFHIGQGQSKILWKTFHLIDHYLSGPFEMVTMSMLSSFVYLFYANNIFKIFVTILKFLPQSLIPKLLNRGTETIFKNCILHLRFLYCFLLGCQNTPESKCDVCCLNAVWIIPSSDPDLQSNNGICEGCVWGLFLLSVCVFHLWTFYMSE